jgi:hypothetical protein
LIVNPEWRELAKNVRMARRSGQKHQPKLTWQPIAGDKEIQKKTEMVDALKACDQMLL